MFLICFSCCCCCCCFWPKFRCVKLQNFYYLATLTNFAAHCSYDALAPLGLPLCSLWSHSHFISSNSSSTQQCLNLYFFISTLQRVFSQLPPSILSCVFIAFLPLEVASVKNSWKRWTNCALYSCHCCSLLWLWSIDAQSILRLNSPIWGCPPHPLLLSPSQVLYSNVTSISYAAQMWLEPGKVQLSFTAHLMLPHNDAVANCAGFSNWSFSLCFFFLTTSTVDLPHIGDAISKSAQQQQRSFLPLPKPFVEQTMWTLLPRGAD